MDWLTAIFGAVREYFGWKTKTDLTPVEKDKQQSRKEYENNNATIDYAAAHGGKLPNHTDGQSDHHQP
jgi:hypothetical protein